MSQLNQFLGSGDIVALHPYQTLYFAIPKVANSSLKAVCADLLRTELGEMYNPRWKPEPFRDRRMRKQLFAMRILLADDDLTSVKDYYSFAFVRNPFDRIASCFTDKVRSDSTFNNHHFVDGVSKALVKYKCFRAGMSFEEFVWNVAEIPDADADQHFRSQHLFITDGHGEIMVQDVFRFENLQEHFSRVAAKLERPDIQLPHLLKSDSERQQSLWTDRLRDVVRKRYAEDFRCLGYDA